MCKHIFLTKRINNWFMVLGLVWFWFFLILCLIVCGYLIFLSVFPLTVLRLLTCLLLSAIVPWRWKLAEKIFLIFSQNALLKLYQYSSGATEGEAHVSPLVQLVQISLFSTEPLCSPLRFWTFTKRINDIPLLFSPHKLLSMYVQKQNGLPSWCRADALTLS